MASWLISATVWITAVIFSWYLELVGGSTSNHVLGFRLLSVGKTLRWKSTSRDKWHWSRLWITSPMSRAWGREFCLTCRKGGWGQDLLSCKYLKGGCSNMELGVLSRVTSNRRKQNDLKFHEGRLDLIFKKMFWNGFPGKWWNHHPWKMYRCGVYGACLIEDLAVLC